MDQLARSPELSPYRLYSVEDWAKLRAERGRPGGGETEEGG